MATFIKLAVPTYLNSYMSLKMLGDKKFAYGRDYYYVEVPTLTTFEEGKLAPKGKWVEIKAAATVAPKKSRVMVVPNPLLVKVAALNPTPMIEMADGEVQLAVVANFHKDFDLSTLEWLVRVYLLD